MGGGRSIDYTKTIPLDVQEKIKRHYILKMDMNKIEEYTGITKSIAKKFLIQCGTYVFRDTKTHIEIEFDKLNDRCNIPKVHYENDVVYKLHNLSQSEYDLFSDEEHNELKKLN